MRKDEPFATNATATWTRQDFQLARQRIERLDLFVTGGFGVRLSLKRNEPHREAMRDRKRAAFQGFDVRTRAIEFAREFVRAPSLRVAQLPNSSWCDRFSPHFCSEFDLAVLVMTCVL